LGTARLRTEIGTIASIGAGLAARVDMIPGGWWFDLFEDFLGAPPLVTCYVAAPTGGLGAWRTLCRDRRIQNRAASTMSLPPDEPWLSVCFRPAFL
jgi:hypothetical protein